MPLSGEDILAIHHLATRYALATDNADVDGFMNCWADDRPVCFESVFGTLNTREAIREFEDEHVNRGVAIGKRRQTTNLLVEEGEDADTAYLTNDVVIIEVKELPEIIATGRYNRSRVVRTAKGWRFQRRALEVDTGYQEWLKIHDV